MGHILTIMCGLTIVQCNDIKILMNIKNVKLVVWSTAHCSCRGLLATFNQVPFRVQEKTISVIITKEPCKNSAHDSLMGLITFKINQCAKLANIVQ